MRYKDYPNWTNTYVIVQNSGFGVMEAPYEEVREVGSVESYEDAVQMAKEFEAEYNTPEQIESSWKPNTFHINVNTLTTRGKELLSEMEAEAERVFQKVKDNPDDYDTIQQGGFTYHMQKIEGFFDSKTEEHSIDFGILIPKGKIDDVYNDQKFDIKYNKDKKA